MKKTIAGILLLAVLLLAQIGPLGPSGNPVNIGVSTIKPLADSTTAITFTKADGTTAVMIVDTTNQRVGIGTANPGAQLDVNMPGSNATRVRVSNGNGAAQYSVDANGNTVIRNESASKFISFEPSSEVARFAPTSGNFLLGGTTDGNYRLDVQKSGSTGTARFFDQTASTGSTLVTITPGAGQSGSVLTVGGSLSMTGGSALQSTGGAAPTLTAGCNGAGSSVAVGSTNNRGQFTTQTAAVTTCTLTWSAAGVWNQAPFCVFTDGGATTTPVAFSGGAIGTSTAVVDFASASNKVVNYVCM